MQPQPKQWQQADDNTPIIQAVINGDFNAVQALIKEDQQHLLTLSNSGLSPLCLACFYGHEKIIQHLIQIEEIMALDPELKAIGIGDINRKEGPSCLNAIAYIRSTYMIELDTKLKLISMLELENTNRNRQQRQATPWKFCTDHIKNSLQWQSMSTNSALITAIQQNDFENVMQLINVDKSCLLQRSVPGFSPLHVACLLGHAEIALHILDQEKLLVQQDPTLAKIGIGDPNRVESNTLPMSARDCLQYSFSYKENRHQQLNPLLESLESSAARVTEEREHALAQRHINTNKSSGHQLHLLTPHRNNPNQETTSIAADEHCKICTIS